MVTLALVEDNDDLRQLTEIYLSRQGFIVCSYADAEDFLASSASADIYVIDINLSVMSGFDLVARLRLADPNASLVILSARERKFDIIKGYNAGADLYLTKPTEPEILLAAINRLADRLKSRVSSLNTLEIHSRKILFGGRSQTITPAEMAFLHRLVVAGPRGLERFEIAECFAIDLDNFSAKALEVRILRLRQKISTVGFGFDAIETVRGFGYRISPTAKFIFK